MYAAYHPNAFESSLVRHQEGAAAAASLLAADIHDGKLEPSAPGFNQGLAEGDEAEGGEGDGAGKDRPQAPEGPMCLWKPARAAQDYRVAKKLVAVVDHQRGLQLADNPLLPQDVIAAAAASSGDGAQEGKDADMGERATQGFIGRVLHGSSLFRCLSCSAVRRAQLSRHTHLAVVCIRPTLCIRCTF